MTDGIYSPTPKQIEEACKEIRDAWTPHQKQKRWQGEKYRPWEPPTIRLEDLPENAVGWIDAINISNEEIDDDCG